MPNGASWRVRILIVWLLRVGGLALAFWAIVYGLRLRTDLWKWSAPIRFDGDIANALGQGNGVLDEASSLARAEGHPISGNGIPARLLLRAFVKRYDTVVEQSSDNQYGLDYTPARLLIMSFWARYVRRVDPSEAHFSQEDAVPLVRFNIGCDITAAGLMFLLVRFWTKRSRGRTAEWAWLMGLLAALVSWFNPSTLVDAHVWPQWDVWIVPFYLAAMYLASIEWWFAAGISVAIGAMFKGQILMVAPVLVLWPLFGGRWSAALRIMIGFFFAAGLAASPWLARNVQAWTWIGMVLLLSLVLLLIGRNRPARVRAGRWIWPVWSIVPIIALIEVPFGASHPAALALAAAVAFIPWLAPMLSWRGTAVWLAGILTGCIFLSASAFAGTWSWYAVGFAYPTRHYLDMAHGGINLAAILGDNYRWQVADLVGHLGRWNVTIKTLLIAIYALTLVLCGAGAAVHHWRRDARALISLTAPWVLMFAILPQMHERYLMWAAATCGVALASSLGMSLMHLVVIGLSFSMIGRDLFPTRPDFLPRMSRFLGGIDPGIGWMVLLAAAVYLFVAVVPRRRHSARSGNTPIAPAIDFPAERSYAWADANQASEAVGSPGAIPADSK